MPPICRVHKKCAHPPTHPWASVNVAALCPSMILFTFLAIHMAWWGHIDVMAYGSSLVLFEVWSWVGVWHTQHQFLPFHIHKFFFVFKMFAKWFQMWRRPQLPPWLGKNVSLREIARHTEHFSTIKWFKMASSAWRSWLEHRKKLLPRLLEDMSQWTIHHSLTRDLNLSKASLQKRCWRFLHLLGSMKHGLEMTGWGYCEIIRST